MMRAWLGIVALGWVGCGSAETEVLRSHVAGLAEEVKALKTQITALERANPDQATIMALVGYHASALLPAIQAENWPLAQYYLEQTFASLRWAVRVRPVYVDTAGRPVKLDAILESIENTQLVAMRAAIQSADRPVAEKAFEQLVLACYGCHVAADRPFLRPKTPDRPEVEVLHFDPKAKVMGIGP